MKKELIAIGFGSMFLAACSMTLPVHGQLPDTNEEFSGTATGHWDGGGELTIISNKGATCKGSFVYVSNRNGEGILTCDDGRTGPFKFVSTGTQGSGYGDLNNKRFTFTFGK